MNLPSFQRFDAAHHPQTDEHLAGCLSCMMAHDKALPDEEMPAALPLYRRLVVYRRLADGLSDMVEDGRLDEAAIPDDYEWIVDTLAQIAKVDPK